MANCIQCGRKLPPLTFGKKICQWCVQHERAQNGETDDDTRQPVMPAPWVRRGESTITLTHVLFGANVAVFLAMVLAGGSFKDFSGPLMLHFGANYGPLTLSGDWWRLLTYMFVHAEIWHIGFNMWCLWDLGALCESLYGRWTYLAVYLITGVASGVSSVGWNPGVLSIGASGAIFGLAGALIASFYLGEFSLPGFVIQTNLKSLLFFAGFNILFGISPIGDLFGIRVDNAAHIGGLVSGLILGALIARVAPQHDVRRAAVLAVMVFLVAGCALGVSRWRGAPFRAARAFESLPENGPDRMIAQLQAVVRQRPNFTEAHFALGQAYFNQEKYSQAESEFKRVLELQPQHATARFDLGLVYLNEKRFDDAKATFTQILAQDANNADAHYGLGLVLADEQKYQAAIEEFKTAVAGRPQASGVYFELGNSYAELKMYDDAIATYNKGKETEGDDPDLETGLAEAYQAKGMTQQADEARNKAAQLKAGHHD
jgi:membrane associated rhomboid family serine protease/cytochrome c-type biogenesis protein CcmH/NrfG